MFSGSEGILLHIFIPDPPAGSYNNHTALQYPEVDISLLHSTSPVSIKFRPPTNRGPSDNSEHVLPLRPKQIQYRRILFFFCNPATIAWRKLLQANWLEQLSPTNLLGALTPHPNGHGGKVAVHQEIKCCMGNQGGDDTS